MAYRARHSIKSKFRIEQDALVEGPTVLQSKSIISLDQ